MLTIDQPRIADQERFTIDFAHSSFPDLAEFSLAGISRAFDYVLRT